MRWLLTYADMITLLMVFFIVLFAMASVDKQKYAALARSLQIAISGGSGILPGTTGQDGSGTGTAELPMPADLPVLPGRPAAPPTAGAAVPPGALPEEDPLVRLGRDLAITLKGEGRFAVYTSERGVVLSLVGTALFGPGEVSIRPEARPLLHAIADRLRGIPNDVSVEGSADDRPINTPMFPSNWELSVRRATEVVRYFTEVEGLDPRRFIAVGYAEFRPAFDNSTPEGRARNRRVDIVILREHYRVGLDTHVTATGQETVPGAIQEPAAPSGVQEPAP